MADNYAFEGANKVYTHHDREGEDSCVERHLRERDLALAAAGELAANPTDVYGVRFVGHRVDGANAGDVRKLALDIRGRMPASAPSVVTIIGSTGGKPAVVVAVNDEARSWGVSANALVKVAASALGGSGGGKDDVAQGGGADVTHVDEALRAVEHEVGRSGTGAAQRLPEGATEVDEAPIGDADSARQGDVLANRALHEKRLGPVGRDVHQALPDGVGRHGPAFEVPLVAQLPALVPWPDLLQRGPVAHGDVLPGQVHRERRSARRRNWTGGGTAGIRRFGRRGLGRCGACRGQDQGEQKGEEGGARPVHE